MEKERIETIKTWSEANAVRDIQVFLDFANFYRRFIKNFSRIAAPFTSMLWTTNEPSKIVFPSIKAKHREQNKKLRGGRVDVGGGKIENLSMTKINRASGTDFLTSETKIAFFNLQKAFIKASILYHLDLASHIQIETDVSGYAIGGILSQLTLDHSFSSHMISINSIFPKSKIGQ